MSAQGKNRFNAQAADTGKVLPSNYIGDSALIGAGGKLG
jgi:hypothetical protein